MVAIKYDNKDTISSLYEEEDDEIIAYYERNLSEGKCQAYALKAQRQGPAPIISTDIVAVYTAECETCKTQLSISHNRKDTKQKVISTIEGIFSWHHATVTNHSKIEWFCPQCKSEVKFKDLLL